MKVSFEGIGAYAATFYNSASAPAKAGQPVKMGESGTVAACSAGDSYLGVAVTADGDFAGVQLQGFVTLPYTGTAPTPGLVTLGADGSGGVKTVSTGGRGCWVIQVDTAASTVGFLL